MCAVVHVRSLFLSGIREAQRTCTTACVLRFSFSLNLFSLIDIVIILSHSNTHKQTHAIKTGSNDLVEN